MRLSTLRLGMAAAAAAAVAHAAPDATKAQAVKDAFRLSWKGYYDNAFPHDTLLPISRKYEDDRNGWGVTAVDSLSTAIIMGETDIVDQILDFVPKIDFTTTAKVNETISVFESNIRYIGGLLSAYDLLKGPFGQVASDETKVDALLTQAQTLADGLAVAFGTDSGVPAGDVIFNPGPPQRVDSGENSLAGAGTLVLEWTRLADLTGNATYAKLAQRCEAHLLSPEGPAEPFPGLVGSNIDTATGAFVDNAGGWDGGTDSFYEYLVKMYLYDPKAFEQYRTRWEAAADSTIQYLASNPSSRDDLTFLARYSGTKLSYQSTHLGSFAGGSFILGGIVFGSQDYIDFGVELTKSYYATYTGSASGIGPEVFAWAPADGNATVPDDQREQFDKAGFWPTASSYLLRPETLESVYYAYRVTGDTRFQDDAWKAFERIEDLCRAGVGYSGLGDVSDPRGGKQDDFQQSFWTAETLKYLYLIFAPESAVQIRSDGKMDFVFNTEAHPFRVRP